MGWTKVKDLAVVVGSYQKDGQTKNRYQNVGQVLRNDQGEEMMMLSRFFNPAGVPYKDGSDSIIISQFDPRDKDQGAPTKTQQQASASDSDDNIPF